MEKRKILIIIFLIIIPSVFAGISCPDGTKPESDLSEIDLGLSRVINNLGVGLTKTEERQFFKRVSADLLIDTRRVEISNKSSSQIIDLLSGQHTVVFENSTDTMAKISIDGESKEILENEVETIKGIFVRLFDADTSNGGTAKLIIGAKQITLSNDEKPAEKLLFKNITYLVKLDSASSTNVIVSVSFCKTGKIIYESDIKNNSMPNNTQEAYNQNQSEIINTTEFNEEISIKEGNESNNNESVSNNQEKTEVETSLQNKKEEGFFISIWNWFKNLFR